MTTETTIAIPEVFASEWGDTWSAQGHIEPTLMVLGTIIEHMVNIDGDAATEFAVGGEANYRTDGSRPWQLADQMKHANGLLQCVTHHWVHVDEEDDERMVECDESHPDAEPWTTLTLRGA